jgi:hypothetical protein
VVTTAAPVPWAPASFGDHTSGSGNMVVYNGSANANERMWYQDVALDRVHAHMVQEDGLGTVFACVQHLAQSRISVGSLSPDSDS